MTYFAHSGTPGDKGDWQTLPDHSQAVARRAAESARWFGLEKAAYVAGLLHDLGKYNPAFQRRLDGANDRVDHSTAGAAILMQLAPQSYRWMAELISYAILGHHAGLPDRHNQFGHCFKRRLDEFKGGLDPIWEQQLNLDLSELASPELVKKLTSATSRQFDFSVLGRFLFSCLVDADYKDTQEYYSAREGRQPDRQWNALGDILPELTTRFDAHMAGKRGGGDLNRLRDDVLAHVRAGAALEPGLFTLTVPTGGGKTLASLGFALDHAARHGHRRIVYGIPFMGAWIETTARWEIRATRASPLAWARGSKHVSVAQRLGDRWSPLAWGVGRNQTSPLKRSVIPQVVPRGGVDRHACTGSMLLPPMSACRQ